MTDDRTLKVGFVTVCRGRLHHLKQSLPAIVSECPDEVIVVDHACPQGAGAWVEGAFPDVGVLYIRDELPFVLSRARNVGIEASKADILCLIDADVIVQPGFVSWIRKNARDRVFYRHASEGANRNLETWGTFVAPRALLVEVGLYDEAFDGWGGEDDDIYYRLTISGSIEGEFPFPLVEWISHDDEERLASYEDKRRSNHHLINRLYAAAKRVILAIGGPKADLPLSFRTRLRNDIRSAVLSSEQTGKSEVVMQLSGGGWEKDSVRVDKNVTLKLTLENLGLRDDEPA